MNKKKARGIKQIIREERKREKRIVDILAVAVLVAIVGVSGFATYSMLTPHWSIAIASFKAAIVDQGSLSPAAGPNEAFIEDAKHVLEQAGYVVDYYSGGKVNVEFFKNLPTHGYRLIVLRVHSSATDTNNEEAPVTLFTSERYAQTRHVYEQVTGQLAVVAYSKEDWEKGVTYFGIYPSFIKESMKTRFQNTTIVMMGCEGLDNPSMAKAFVEKGAKAYISWDQSVLTSHTDRVATNLLKHLVLKKQTIAQAVENAMKEVGPDPAWKSHLIYYPAEIGGQTVEDSLR